MADLTLTQDDDDELARLASTAGSSPGAVLEDYEIGRELGSGSFATCWAARHKRTGQEVAVKVIEVRPGQGLQQMAEIEHMVKVGRHPSILEVRDARMQGAHIYLISPLCQGSLEERMERPFTPEQWREWLVQAAEGLSLLHRCQIVHCDVKPANLLLDRHDHLLLADLGQARPLSDTRPRMGSYFYMPPEQAEGGPPRVSWDVYALGASFFCALTGYPPRSRSFVLEGDDHAQRLSCYTRELPQAALLQPHQVPADCWPLLRQMLEIDPKRRTDSMEKVLRRLKRREGGPGGKTLVGVAALGLGVALLAQLLRGGLVGELFLWGSLTVGVLGRLLLLCGLVGALAGAGLQAWEFQRNR